MENCFIKKLQAVVNNDNLEKMNEVVFTAKVVAGSTDLRCIPLTGKTITVTNTLKNSGKLLTSGGQEVSSLELIPSSYTFKVSDNPILSFISKYDIQRLQNFQVPVDIVKGLSGLEQLMNILFVDNEGNAVTDYSSIAGNEKITLLTMLNVNFTNFASVVDTLPNLTRVGFTAATEVITTTQLASIVKQGIVNVTLPFLNISGSLESFVLAFKDRLSTNSLNIDWTGNSPITFNSVAIGNYPYTLQTVTWVANSSDPTKTDITFRGVTVTV